MKGVRTILVVEDSSTLARAYEAQLAPLGHTILIANDGQSSLKILEERAIDCVLLDLNLPDMDGLAILDKVRAFSNPPAVIVVTANASLTVAVQAVRAGAYDYLVKPSSAARLLTTVGNALATTDLKREVQTFRKTVDSGEFHGFVGRSLAMQAVYRTIDAAARSTASVFITGESGTGKELAAEALHKSSPRAEREFVAINCGAIPKDLMESVIFGHVKGAFTGATSDQDGAAARADGGTLFLDELGEMEPSLQTKLLRFIQTGAFERVGDNRTRKADIRFVAATNRDPEVAIREGRLREDLFYRLNVVPILLPPLRERGQDILLIAHRFLKQYAEAEGRRFVAFAPDVEARLSGYGWPGNVRQLQNVIRNIVILNDSDIVTADMLPAMTNAGGAAPSRPSVAPAQPVNRGPATDSSRDQLEPMSVIERRYIENALAVCGGDIPEVASRLGISQSTIYRKRDIWNSESEDAGSPHTSH